MGFFRVFFVKLRSNRNVILIKVSGTEMWVDKNVSIKFYSTLELSDNRTHAHLNGNNKNRFLFIHRLHALYLVHHQDSS